VVRLWLEPERYMLSVDIEQIESVVVEPKTPWRRLDPE
jgi:hypothetical protein